MNVNETTVRVLRTGWSLTIVVDDFEHTLRVSVLKKTRSLDDRARTQWSVSSIRDHELPEGDWGDDMLSGVGQEPSLDERMETLGSFLGAYAESQGNPESENGTLFRFSPDLAAEAAAIIDAMVVRDRALACGHVQPVWIDSDDESEKTDCPVCGLIVGAA